MVTPTDVLYFLPPLMGFLLLLIGFAYENYVSGVFGGVLLFLFGIAVLLSPLTSWSELMNTVVGSVCFGYGAYVMITASMERVQADSMED
jgi:hypothetical protein